MNRPKDALKHQLVFNSMMLKEFEEDPGTDMRLGISFNQLGVAYMMNDGRRTSLQARLRFC
jgi:hypothetical protein